MVISILVIGKRTNEKEKDAYMFLMNLDSLKKATLEIGKWTKEKETESSFIKMTIDMKAPGPQISLVEWESL